MSELTDLEICKRIAEIEGVLISDCGEYIVPIDGSLPFKPMSQLIAAKDFCFDLMIKNEINLILTSDEGWCAEFGLMRWVMGENPQRAICLAVIKKSELE